MKKKMIIAVIFVAAFALAASATFASTNYFNSCCFPFQQQCCPEVKVDADTKVKVKNNVEAKADTGDNTIYSHSYWYGKAKIETGGAMADNFMVATSIKGSEVDVNMPYKGEVKVDADTYGYVNNDVEAKADTGDNKIIIKSGKAKIMTGDAMAQNEVHTSVTGSKVNIY